MLQRQPQRVEGHGVGFIVTLGNTSVKIAKSQQFAPSDDANVPERFSTGIERLVLLVEVQNAGTPLSKLAVCIGEAVVLLVVPINIPCPFSQLVVPDSCYVTVGLRIMNDIVIHNRCQSR